MTCPCCSRKLTWRDVRLQSAFWCPACDQRLRCPKFYGFVLGNLTLGFALSFWYVLGARGAVWLALALVSLPVVQLFLSVLAQTIYPPTLQLLPDEHLTDGLLHLRNDNHRKQ
jgi:hypothetical protein